MRTTLPLQILNFRPFYTIRFPPARISLRLCHKRSAKATSSHSKARFLVDRNRWRYLMAQVPERPSWQEEDSPEESAARMHLASSYYHRGHPEEVSKTAAGQLRPDTKPKAVSAPAKLQPRLRSPRQTVPRRLLHRQRAGSVPNNDPTNHL